MLPNNNSIYILSTKIRLFYSEMLIETLKLSMTPKKMAETMFNNADYINVMYKVVNPSEKAKRQILEEVNFKLQSHFQGELSDYWSKVKAEIIKLKV